MSSPNITVTASAAQALAPSRLQVLQVGPGGGVRAGPCTGQRGHQACKMQRRSKLVGTEAEVGTKEIIVVQPRHESGPEGIAGSNGVDDFYV
jgi:hypothetical protein